MFQHIVFANILISHCKLFKRSFLHVNVTVINIAIVDGHDFITTYSYGCFLDDRSTKILVNERIGILLVISISKGRH